MKYEGERCDELSFTTAGQPQHCKGIIALAEVENCACHIVAPCTACTALRHYCPECDWHEEDG